MRDCLVPDDRVIEINNIPIEMYAYSDEEFKPIAGFPGRFISNYGRVAIGPHRKGSGKGRFVDWRISESKTLSGGYLHVSFRKDGKNYNFKIHRLVAAAFLPKPAGIPNPTVDHIDNNPFNNHFTNLQWLSNAENLQKSHAERGFCCLTEELVREIMRMRAATGFGYWKIARVMNLTRNSVRGVLDGRSWQHITNYPQKYQYNPEVQKRKHAKQKTRRQLEYAAHVENISQ